MLKYFIYVLFLFIITNTLGQKVYQNTSRLILTEYNQLSNDGLIVFEVEVRMTDCISHIEIIDLENYRAKKNILDKLYDFWWFQIIRIYNFSKTKKLVKNISDQSYILKDYDDGKEHIFVNVPILNIKSLYDRKETTKRIKIILYSFSGKKIYDENFNVKKTDLLNKAWISPNF